MSTHYVVEINIKKVTKVTPTVVGHRGGVSTGPNVITSEGERNVEDITRVIHKAATLGKVIATTKAMLDIVDGEQEFDE